MPEETLIITAAAKALLDKFFQQNPEAVVRLEQAAGGCAGPRLQLRLNEGPERLGDMTLDRDGYTFVVEGSLLQAAMPVTIDATKLTFAIRSALQLEAGGCKTCEGCT